MMSAVLVDDPPRLALVGALLCAGNAALLPPIRLGFERLFPGRSAFFARWGFLDVARVVVAGMVVAWLLGLEALGLRAALAGLPGPLGALVTTALVLGAMAATAITIARRTEPAAARSLGFTAARVPSGLAAGVFLYAAFLPALFGLLLLSPWLLQRLGAEFEFQDLVGELLAARGLTAVAGWLLVVLLLPLLEETLFRGFLQPLLVQNLREVLGIGTTSLLFAALHGPSAFPSVFGLSCILGAVRLRTRGIWGPFLVHALHNGLVLGLHLAFPELRETS